MIISGKQWWLREREPGRTYLELGDRGLPPAGIIHGMYKDQLDTLLAVLQFLGFEETEWSPLFLANTGKHFTWRQIDHMDTIPVGWYEVQWKDFARHAHISHFTWEWEQIFREDPVERAKREGAIAGLQYGI